MTQRARRCRGAALQRDADTEGIDITDEPSAVRAAYGRGDDVIPT